MSGYPTAAPALKIAYTILKNALNPVEVHTKVPYPTRPAEFVTVGKIGGTRPLIVTSAARILVQCWAGSVADVEDLANDAIAALQNAQGTTVADLGFVRGFDNIEGPVDFPDPDVTDLERWQFQGDLLVSTS